MTMPMSHRYAHGHAHAHACSAHIHYVCLCINMAIRGQYGKEPKQHGEESEDPEQHGGLIPACMSSRVCACNDAVYMYCEVCVSASKPRQRGTESLQTHCHVLRRTSYCPPQPARLRPARLCQLPASAAACPLPASAAACDLPTSSRATTTAACGLPTAHRLARDGESGADGPRWL